LMKALGWFAVCAVVGVAGCSIIDGKFNECKVDSDCSNGRICVGDPLVPGQNFCIVNSTPVGCSGILDAGVFADYGDVDAGTIHIGAAINFTSTGGVLSESKVANYDAIKLAIDEINANQGAGHRTFVIHTCDTAGDSNQLKTQVAWLIQHWQVPAIIIPGSTNVLTANALTTPAGVMIMSPTATSPSISQLGTLAEDPDSGTRLVWRTCPSDALQGSVIADLIDGTSTYDAGFGDPTRIGIIYTNESYGQGLEDVISTRIADAGVQLKTNFYTRDGTDYMAAMDTLALFAPNVTVLVAYPEDTPKILNYATSMHPELTADAGHRWLFTDSAKDPSLISGVTNFDEIATASGTAPAQGAGAAYPTFSQRFQNEYGIDPSDYGFTSHSYDAMYLIALGADFAVGSDNAAPLTGARIAQGLAQVSSGPDEKLGTADYVGARAALQSGQSVNVNGTSGPLDFDPLTGESPAPIEYWGITPTDFQTLAIIVPPAD
jgi:branched-chain amino acid transport system substrate-binding protein